MESEIIKFISEFTAVKAEKITPNTLINIDLGVDGDDGAELLEEYSKRFNVDLSPISEVYFGPEGMPISLIILWPYYLVRWLLGYKTNVLAPLSVSQLIKSAEAGKWVSM
jgi:acyl carrier protein